MHHPVYQIEDLLLFDKPGVESGFIEILWSGDKSDDTFLFNFSILNVENAQSVDNCRCAMMFNGNDIYDNLKVAFERADLGNDL